MNMGGFETEVAQESGLQVGGVLSPGDPNFHAPGRSQWQLFLHRFLRHRMAVASLVVLGFLFIICFGAHWIAPHNPTDQNILAGGTGPSAKHWLGTDDLGRDEFSRLLYAGQISLKIGLTVALLSTVVGAIAGAIAGYASKAADQVLMRTTDLFLIVPAISILAIALQKFGHTDSVVILVIAGLGWMTIARVVRGQVLSIKTKEYIDAARSSGASPTRIIVRHILPNIIGPICVNATLAVGIAIITESTLSYLGFGIQPPATSWGNLLSDARTKIGTHQAYLIYFPGIAILITVLAVNFLGDGLRDALDPQSEKH